MGQRFQIIIITPEEYWNADNCNNRKGRILVYHAQWLWGYYAIWRLGQLVKGIKEKMEREKDSPYPINYEETIDSVMKWVCYKNLHSQNRIEPYFENAEYKFKIVKDNWNCLIKELSNNNGIFLLKIDKNGSMNYAFYNPAGNESHKSRQRVFLDWKNYLKDYNTEKERNFFEVDAEYKESIKMLEGLSLMRKFPKIESWMVNI